MNAAESLPAPERLERLIELWRLEHAELIERIRAITLWLGSTCRGDAEPFEELATRLQQFRERLLSHFEREDALGDDLRAVHGCAEADANARRAASDHPHLVRRVEDLISRLTRPQPEFDSFQDAVEQVSLFVDAVEQHEEEEAMGLQWLSSPCSESRPAGEF